MLLYNVCYLAHTQAVEIPLSQAGEVLSNLWSVCCSTELGRFADFPLPHASDSLILVDAVDLTRHTRYFCPPRRPASHWILHNYSKLLLPPPPRDRARRAHALQGQLEVRATYPKRTSGTCWTMMKQVLPNSPNASAMIVPHIFPPTIVLCNTAIYCSITACACITLSFHTQSESNSQTQSVVFLLSRRVASYSLPSVL